VLSWLQQDVLNKYCTLHYLGEKLSFLYDATLFSHYKAKGLRVPAQAPGKTHLNKTGTQYSNVGNIYMSQMHSLILNPSLVLMFIYYANTSAISKTNQLVYYTAKLQNISSSSHTKYNNIQLNYNYDHDKTSMWAENTNLVQEVPIIHFSTCEGHYFVYQKYIKIPHTSNIISMAHKFYLSKCFQVVPPTY